MEWEVCDHPLGLPANLLRVYRSILSSAVSVTAVLVASCAVSQAGSEDREVLLHPDAQFWTQQAPGHFKVRFVTSEGDFVAEVKREQAPLGVDRFYNLVRAGFYDDSRFFRVRDRYIAQFGIAGDPTISAVWRDRTLADDPVRASNLRGSFAYAMTGPNTRTTQIYINLVDNTHLDDQGFAPLGRVTEGMDVVDRLFGGYGENSGGGMRRGNQGVMFDEGNEYLDRNYPLLTELIRAKIEE